MNRTITTEQSQQLLQFCREQNVEHYDLQIELVDHLASAIEEQWMQCPERSFEAALQKVYKQFGSNGFQEICKTERKALARKYERLHLQFFFRFFRWPQIVLTFAFTYLLFELIIITERIQITYFIYFAIAIGSIAYFYFYHFPKKIKFEVKDKTKFLLLEILKKRYQHFAFFAICPVNVLNFIFLDIFPKGEWATLPSDTLKFRIAVLGVSFLMVCFALMAYSFSVFASKKIKQHFMEQFPEFVK